MRVIGLMSGTSYDAVEAAAAELALEDGELLLRPLGALTLPLDAGVRRRIAAVLPPAATTVEAVCRLDTELGQVFAAAAVRAVEELCSGAADLVVSHGQTVHHWVEDGRVRGTLQLGQPAWIAEATGLPVVSDLRSRDVAAGGQGAPLVGLFDTLLLRGHEAGDGHGDRHGDGPGDGHGDRHAPGPGVRAALNLGGIANITVVPADPDAAPLAFDTGPANALIDAAVREFSGGARDFDEDGRGAAAGRVHPGLLARLLADPYYRRPAPKSTGKEHFHLPYLRTALAAEPVPDQDDVLATLTRLTAVTVAEACRAHGVGEIFASGGGARNPTLMRMLAEEAPELRIAPSAELGVDGTAKEALAFAVLGFLTVHGLPASVPSCTGARRAAVLGSLTPGCGPLTLPAAPGAGPRTPPRALRVLRSP
jgi:anhydro-N-acetylmuramic acid kinase